MSARVNAWMPNTNVSAVVVSEPVIVQMTLDVIWQSLTPRGRSTEKLPRWYGWANVGSETTTMRLYGDSLFEIGQPFPTPVPSWIAAEMIVAWLGSEDCVWPRSPDCDGSVSKDGCRIETVSGSRLMVDVTPVWAEFHK